MTSYLFPNATFSMDRLQSVLGALNGKKDKLVIDLSCRRKDDKWIVAMNKWQTLTDMEVNHGMSTFPRYSHRHRGQPLTQFV